MSQAKSTGPLLQRHSLKLQRDRELVMFRFYFPLCWFCYVIFTRIILSTPACDVLLYVRLKTTCAAIKFRKRLLTISKINITPWNMYRDNNFHSRRYVLRVSVSENKWAYTHKLQKPCRFKPASRCLRQNEPRGKNIAQSFLFTAKSITKYIVFCVTFSLYLWSENVKTF